MSQRVFKDETCSPQWLTNFNRDTVNASITCTSLMLRTLTLLSLALGPVYLAAQPEKKELMAVRTSSPMVIDGVLDEPGWEQASGATGFTQLDPNPGEPASQPNSIKVLYDDGAVYVGAMLYDSAPDSILKQLSERDEQDNTDWFGVGFDTYRDGLNMFAFWVTPAGVQGDVKFSPLDDDESWDAVWESDVKINSEGWVAEFRIPYSALRFPEVEVQTWGINFVRAIRRIREESWWNPVDPERQDIVAQLGVLHGINNVTTPVRLSVTPYVAGYYDVQSGGGEPTTSRRSFNGGLDLKYGISDAFTLDMTLIPDFGQVKSDEQVYNFTPFEVRFDENRQFFTEGTELFNKAGLFYSRRIGGTPIGFSDVFDQIDSTQTLLSNPTEGQLVNAIKISGRTKKNLGIGLFNAVEARSFAEVEEENGDITRIQTQPLTNYNVFVLDQGLKNNSYAAVINTNVFREGGWYDANVVGTDINIRDKPNKYALGILGSVSSQFFGDSTNLGFKYRVRVQRTSGQLTGSVSYYVENNTYNPNDLGFLRSNNIARLSTSVSYNIYQPFGVFKKMFNTGYVSYGRQFKPNLYSDFSIGANNVSILKGSDAYGFGFEAGPAGGYDHFESREPGRATYYPPWLGFDAWLSTDYRRRFAIDLRGGRWSHTKEQGFPRNGIWYTIEPRVRVNDKLSFRYKFNKNTKTNDVGFATTLADTIVFGRRSQNITESTLYSQFIFNNKMGLGLDGRHYWARASYKGFYALQEDGNLTSILYTGVENGESLHDINYNAFTLDLVFRWFFAPGSELSIVWKNAIFEEGSVPEPNFGTNFNNLLMQPQLNSFSIKMLYYLDYLKVREAFRG